MGLFRRKKLQAELQHDNRVEIVVNKGANKDAVEEAKHASATLNKILDENGFTLKIFLAAHNQKIQRGTK